MKNKTSGKMPLRYLLFILSFLCLGSVVLTFLYPSLFSSIKNKVDTVFMPMQAGLNEAGSSLADSYSSFRTMKDAQKENEELKARIAKLEEENLLLYQQTYELQELQDLLKVKDTYSSYEMVGARVIQKETGNWYHEFLVNKGADDGIVLNANVLADGALVGRVIFVGKNYSRVLSIIDDESSVGAMSLETSDFCIVSGDLTLFEEGKLHFGFADKDAALSSGQLLVTSPVSDIYLPNIAIGYIEEVKTDANNLTQSGYVIPIADFKKIQNVMIVTTTKEEWTQNLPPEGETMAAEGETQAEAPGTAENETTAEDPSVTEGAENITETIPE